MQGLYGGPIDVVHLVALSHQPRTVAGGVALGERRDLVRRRRWHRAGDTDGGKTWANVSPPDLPDWTTISAIEPSPHARGTAYVAGHGYRVSNRTPYLYKTTDYGKTWRGSHRVSERTTSRAVIREDPVRPGPAVRWHRNRRLRVVQRRRAVAIAAEESAGGARAVHARERRRSGGGHARPRLLDHGQPERAAADHAGGDVRRRVISSRCRLQSGTPRCKRSRHAGRSAGIQLTGTSGEVAFIDQRSSDWTRDTHVSQCGGESVDRHDHRVPTSSRRHLRKSRWRCSMPRARKFSGSPAERGRALVAGNAGVNRFVWDLRYPNARQLPVDPRLTGPGDSARASAPIAPPGQYRAPADRKRSNVRAALRNPKAPQCRRHRCRSSGAVHVHDRDTRSAIRSHRYGHGDARGAHRYRGAGVVRRPNGHHQGATRLPWKAD